MQKNAYPTIPLTIAEEMLSALATTDISGGLSEGG
jgi:hypothetical protein